MPEILGIEKLFCVRPNKRLGVFRLFGTSQFAHSNFGDEDIFFVRDPYGRAVFGGAEFADSILLSGIYRTDNVTGRTKFYREPYYITKNPRYGPQQTWRQVFADSVSAWQALTTEQKAVYNISAKGKRMSGYNLFLKEYLRSH